MTELGGSQISSLMEVLPGIAQVLRSPVADAIVNLVKMASRVREFDLADAEELLRYAVRRNLMTADESDRVLAEARESVQRRADRAGDREKAKLLRPKALGGGGGKKPKGARKKPAKKNHKPAAKRKH